MSDQDAITAKLMQPFPREAIKTRQGGGNARLSYVEGHTVIHRLIDATGNQFDLRVLNLEQKGDLLTALVELTIPGLGSRQHIGVQKVSERGGEDLVKGAITDALKKAATLFGVGLELYGPDYGSEDQAPAPRHTTQQRPVQQARTVLKEIQERTIASARDMAEAGSTYNATKAEIAKLEARATPDEWTEIKRRWLLIRQVFYPDTVKPQPEGAAQ